jgi:gamma-glutamyltranspeptidase/glutathione hydrolase
MSPTIVFDDKDRLYAIVGSPGGSAIIQYVVKTLVGVLDWGLDAQQASALVDFGAANDPTTNVGGEHPSIAATGDPLAAGLRALGHTVNTAPQSSGVATILRVPDGATTIWTGGVDPRRDGIALGDAFRR